VSRRQTSARGVTLFFRLALVQELDWAKEAANLQKNMALGDAKHRRQVHDLFQDIRQSLADGVFALAAQGGFRKQDAVKLLEFLSKVGGGHSEADGSADSVTLTLLMAFLYAIDVSALQKVQY